MSEHTSKRQKKQLAKDGAASLRQKPGWDPSIKPQSSPQEQLRALGQQEKSQAAYQSAEQCQACQEAQQSEGDPTALCQKHLSAAMGL